MLGPPPPPAKRIVLWKEHRPKSRKTVPTMAVLDDYGQATWSPGPLISHPLNGDDVVSLGITECEKMAVEVLSKLCSAPLHPQEE